MGPSPVFSEMVILKGEEKAGLRGIRYAPNDRRARSTMKGPAMQNIGTMRRNGKNNFKGSSPLGWIWEIVAVRLAFCSHWEELGRLVH